jgi:hypothetical protein
MDKANLSSIDRGIFRPMRIDAIGLTSSGNKTNGGPRLDAMSREEMSCPMESDEQRSDHPTVRSVPACHAVVTLHFGNVSYQDIH